MAHCEDRLSKPPGEIEGSRVGRLGTDDYPVIEKRTETVPVKPQGKIDLFSADGGRQGQALPHLEIPSEHVEIAPVLQVIPVGNRTEREEVTLRLVHQPDRRPA